MREQPLRLLDPAGEADGDGGRRAQRAQAYGFPGHVVSGNDLLAVVALSERLVDRMRKGSGPELIECKTYRYRGHSEHDPALYRDKDELIEWEARDPIPQYEFFLEKRGLESEAHPRANRRAHQTGRCQAAVDFAEASPMPNPQEALRRSLRAAPVGASDRRAALAARLPFRGNQLPSGYQSGAARGDAAR